MPVISGTLGLPQAAAPSPTQSGPTIVVQKVNVPGPPGKQGSSAFTLLTAPFIVPPGDDATTATALVQDSSWVGVGQPIFIEGAGIFTAYSVPNDTSILLVNPDFTENAAPGTEIFSQSKVSPAGFGGGGGGGSSYAITAFSISGAGVAAVVVVGSSQAVIDWSATYNFTPTAISISCTGQPLQPVTPTGSSSSGSFTGPFTSNVNGVSITLVITATDPHGGIHTATASMTYATHFVWGSVTGPVTGQGLWNTLFADNENLTPGSAATIPFSSSFGEQQVFARLASFGTPTVTDVSGADTYTANLLGTVQITDNGTLQTMSFWEVGAPGSVFTWKVS
jgi:hypothetical protein